MKTICDMHCDTLCRISDTGEPFFSGANRKGGAGRLQFAAAFVGSAAQSAKERRERADTLIRAFDGIGTEAKKIFTKGDLRTLREQNASGVLLSVEGGGGVDAEHFSFLDTLYAHGVRVFGLAWDDNELSASARSSDTANDYGLTPLGRRVLSRMDELGIVPDVSHLSRRAFADVAEAHEGILLATHSNLYESAPHPRNLLTEEAREIARRGGVIGINIYPDFLAGGRLCDCLSMADDLLGTVGEDAVGFGFDIDGIDTYPTGFPAGCAYHEALISELEKKYPARVVSKLRGENVFRVLSATLP